MMTPFSFSTNFKTTTPRPAAVSELTVAEFLDRYFVQHVQAEALRSAVTLKSRLTAPSQAVLGELAGDGSEAGARSALQGGDPQGHEVGTVNRALSALRAAVNWGRFQDPPFLKTSPFHRFGVSIKARERDEA